MRDNIFAAFAVGFAVGMIVLACMACYYDMNDYNAKKFLGIEGYKHCVIDTQNCHSNWYEIIWKDGKDKR